MTAETSEITTQRRSRPRRRSVLATGAALPLVPALASCAADDGDDGAQLEEIRADAPRAEADPPEEAGVRAAPFAAQLLARLDAGEVNAVCSPLSAQVVLTMVGLGAVGATREQMESVLGGPMDELAQAANTLAQVLGAIGEGADEPGDGDPEPPEAALANGVWLQDGLSLEDAYLEDLAAFFDAGVHPADFVDAASRETARGEINDWVEQRTRGLIEDLVPEDALSEATRLLLVNALYLKAAWVDELGAREEPFTTADGTEVTAETLHGESEGWYEDDLCRATALRTHGDALALALVQPDGDLRDVVAGWEDASDDPEAGLAALLTELEEDASGVELAVPAFDIEWRAELGDPLRELGMVAPFDTDQADFTGITADEPLVISRIEQKAVMTIDETGMEAAAATYVGVDATSAPMFEHSLVLDEPFLVVAYETTTRAPLFVGWIGDPTQVRD